MNLLKPIITGMLLIAGIPVFQAQESNLLLQYRAQVLEYNQDIKSARNAEHRQDELRQAAKADYLPKFSADGNYSYTGNPLELNIQPTESAQPIQFKGNHNRYGASVSMQQPVYMGGAIRGSYDQAQQEHHIATQQIRLTTNNVICEADTRYWNAVADRELIGVANSYHQSVSRLVDVVRHRVEVDYTDRNDLLMAEVKLNEAAYQVLRANNNAEVSRLALNAFAGIPAEEQLNTDSIVSKPTLQIYSIPDLDSLIELRPERQIARHQTEREKAASRVANARFLPQVQIGIDGQYASPGYDFTHDPDPNYAVYAKVSIPIFEWGKRRNTRNAGRYNVSIAREKEQKTTDNLRLETETAYYNYTQSLRQVELTENSLQKASENEELTLDKYREGNISIVEVINAQLYHQQAQINYIQSKLNARISLSQLERTIGSFEK